MSKLFTRLSEKLAINKIKEETISESELKNTEDKIIYEEFIKETKEKLAIEE